VESSPADTEERISRAPMTVEMESDDFSQTDEKEKPFLHLGECERTSSLLVSS
jgi:hypothetical protein